MSPLQNNEPDPPEKADSVEPLADTQTKEELSETTKASIPVEGIIDEESELKDTHPAMSTGGLDSLSDDAISPDSPKIGFYGDSDNESEDLWWENFRKERREREKAEESDDIENERDPDKLHEYIRELQENNGFQAEMLLKYERDFCVSRGWIQRKLITIKVCLAAWIDLLPWFPPFFNNWVLVNRFLIENGAASLPVDFPIGPGSLVQDQTELVLFSISSLIWKCFFGTMLFGASTLDLTLLKALLEGIDLIDPPKPARLVKNWRSDTFRALVATNRYKEQCEEERTRILKLIREMLEIGGFNDRNTTNFADTLGWLDNTVLKPAAELATEMPCSHDDYAWNWTIPAPMIKKSDLRWFEVFDLRWHLTLMPEHEHRFAKLSDDDTIGQSMFNVFPSLSKKGQDGDEDVVISRGWTVVKLHSHLANLYGADNNNKNGLQESGLPVGWTPSAADE